MQVQDSLESYLDYVFMLSHSNHTRKSYHSGVLSFRKFLGNKYNLNESELISKIKGQELDVYALLREFVISLDKVGYAPSSIRGFLAIVKGYLRYLGIKIYAEDCKYTVKVPKAITTREEPLTKEILVRLMRNLSPKLQTVVLVAVATGMRIGEIVQLRISDVDFSYKPVKIKLRAETTKTRESRETFLTEEATNSLKDYLRKFYGWIEGANNEHLKDQIIFGRTSLSTVSRKPVKDRTHSTVNLLQKMLFHQITKISDLSRNNENGRKAIHFHAFRKYFRTVVGNACGRDFAEAIIGHKFYLSTYYNLSEAQKKELYLKAEPYLTISDYAKIEQTIQDLTEKYQKLEEKYDEFKRSASNNTIPIPHS